MSNTAVCEIPLGPLVAIAVMVAQKLRINFSTRDTAISGLAMSKIVLL